MTLVNNVKASSIKFVKTILLIMRRILLSLAFIVVAIVSVSAKEVVAPIDTSDFSGPGIGWGGDGTDNG